MDARGRMLLSGVLVAVAAVLSLLVAVILFQFMSSSAEAEIEEWKFGGAFAGFVATFFILINGISSFFRLFTRDEVGVLLRRIEELNLKVLKGAPVPPNYSPELDELNRISFVRPTAWADWRRQNPLYAFNEKPTKTKGAFAANFNVVLNTEDELSDTYQQFGWGQFKKSNVEDLYERLCQATIDTVKNNMRDYQGTVATEFATVNEVKSLRYIHTFSVATGDDSSPQTHLKIRQSGVFIWMKNRKSLLQFHFTDSEENFTKSSEIFNTILASVRFW